MIMAFNQILLLTYLLRIRILSFGTLLRLKTYFFCFLVTAHRPSHVSSI